LTDQQALFCPSSVRCFELVSQTKPVMAISCLRPVEWNKAAFDELVLPEDKKEVICCMVENHAKAMVQQLTNIIPGKGNVNIVHLSLLYLAEFDKGYCICSLRASWGWQDSYSWYDSQ
jgi:hypothetical protein